MSLYAIGDLHLHYQSQLRAPGQLTEKVWKNHEERFRKNCALIRDSDTLVLVGDHSWGRNLDECEKDLYFFFTTCRYTAYCNRRRMQESEVKIEQTAGIL